MKLSILSLLCTMAFFGCSHQMDGKVSSLQINRVELKRTDTYRYETGIGGDEEGAAIVTQAKHYRTSEIIRDASTNWEVVYIYRPKQDYRGEDYVEIETYQGSDGASPPTKVEIIRIHFVIE